MQDREMVAAIAAGDPAGIAEAYDRYAAPLYTYCRSMLPDPDPADNADSAVRDTFIIATARLHGLRDPDLLGPWLHAVARNECLRQAGAAGGAAELARWPDPDHPVPALMLPAGLREQVLEACADDTPSGRAYRVSVTHRAGPFGRTGFPKPVIPPGPIRWHDVRRHPRAAAGVAAVAVAVLAAGIAAILMAGGPHRAEASALALGGGISGIASAGAPGASAGAPGASSSPSHKAQLAKGTPAPSVPGSTATSQAASGKPKPSAPASSSSGSSPSSSASPTPSPSPSPSPSQGTLNAAPTKLALTAASGKAVTGTFILTAVGGPVSDWAIKVPAAVATKVGVSPSTGSLTSAGAWVTVTVTVKSTVSFSTRLTVDPGGLIITVVLTVKA
jgi:hypothetical protein